MMPIPAPPEQQSFIFNRFLFLKGQFKVVEWLRPCEVKKTCPAPIFKHTRMVMRAGINYDNMRSVIEGRANGTLPAVNVGLPYGKWLVFPYIIECNGEVMLRLYPNGNGQVEEHFFMNGMEVDRDSVACYLYASELRYDDSQPLVKNVKLKNMVSLN